MCPDWLQELNLKIFRGALDGMVREPWMITTSTVTMRESWMSSTESLSGKSLGINLTGPEKAFDWIDIRKSLGIDLTGPGKVLE